MKKLHFRFYSYILASVIGAIFLIVMLTGSVLMFIREEIGAGIGFSLLVIILFFCFWLILYEGIVGGIVINFKKNRLTITPGIKKKGYAIDEIKEMRISFQFDKKYRRWSANVTIYLKNGKLETFAFCPYEYKFCKFGIPKHNKTNIERKAKKCNFIKCYTVE